MCLAIPGEILSIDTDADSAVVAVGEVSKTVSLALVGPVAVGDYVLVHVGYALEKLDPAEAQRTLAMFAEMDERLEALP